MFARNRSCATATLFLIVFSASLVTVHPVAASSVPDPVLQWIGIMNNSVIAGGTNPLVSTRVTALVGASMFDAVNGIHPVYRSLYVRPNAPGYASQRAAAVQAAYVILSSVYPAQEDLLGSLETPPSPPSPLPSARNPSRLAALGAHLLQMPFWRCAPPTGSLHRRRRS